MAGLFSLVIVVALLVVACGSAQPAPEEEGAAEAPQATEAPAATTAPEEAAASDLGRDPQTLIVAIYANPSDFDPASNNEQLGNLVLDATTEGLVRAKADNIEEFEPQLAERWEHYEDYTVWTFYLREGATFHDGTPVNADAVVYSFRRLVASGLGMSFILGQFDWDPETQLTAKDEYTVEFQFNSPTPLLAKALSSGYGSYVVSPTTVQANEKDGDLGHEWLQNNEAGSGAYMLTELSPNQQAVLTRFEDWWGWDDGFHFDQIVLKIVPEQGSRRSLIETGDVDVALDFTPDDWEALMQNPDVEVQLSDGLALQYIVLGDYGPLEDPRVRQALSYAWDYEGYVEGIWKGYAPQAQGPFPRNLLCHDPDVFTYETDLEKAKALLEEAGVGEGLEIRYWTTGEASEIGQMLQAQLAQIGVNLTIEQRETSSFIGTFYGDQEWPERPELMAWTWWPDYNDPTDWAWVLFHSAASGSSGANAGFYSNERADAIMDEAFTVADEAKLCEMYKEFQDIVIRQDPAWIPTIEPPDEAVLRTDIGGYRANPLYRGTFDFYDMYRIGY
jgi:peptide/nickel transport system substrate-binding protein